MYSFICLFVLDFEQFFPPCLDDDVWIYRLVFDFSVVYDLEEIYIYIYCYIARKKCRVFSL